MRSTSTIQQGIIVVVALVFMVAVFAVIANQYLIHVDYYCCYCPVTEDWLQGDTRLYDDYNYDFFNAPWLLFITVPLCAPGYSVGVAIWNTLSILAIIGAIHLWRQGLSVPSYAVIFAVCNPHTFDLWIRAQVDGLILIGIVLGWWAIHHHRPLWLGLAFSIIALKPVNLILVGIIFLISIRDWKRDALVKIFSLPLLVLFLSGFMSGFDWPLRYIKYVRDNPPPDYISITIWKGTAQLGLPNWPFIALGVFCFAAVIVGAWHVQNQRWVVSAAIATGFVFSTFSNGNQYVMLIPAFIYLIAQHRLLGVFAYLLMWTPFTRIFWGSEASWLDIFYPIALLLGAWYFGLQSTNPPFSHESLTPALASE